MVCNAAIKTDDDHAAKHHRAKYSREEAKPQRSHTLQHPWKLGEARESANRCPTCWQSGGAKVTALHYPLLRNRDVPGSEKKFPSQGQISASCIQQVSVYGIYPNEVLKRQFTIPYVSIFPLSLSFLQTKWISAVLKSRALQCNSF